VRRPWRKQGLARALIARSMRLLQEQGMTEAGLGVDAQNPNGALRLYEGLGFRVIRRFATFEKLLD
jgi:ribosomal protein S18 acetylase RimI-like enzyme